MLGQGGTEETPRTVVEWTMIIILRGTADMLESMLLRTISLTLRLAGAVSLPFAFVTLIRRDCPATTD